MKTLKRIWMALLFVGIVLFYNACAEDDDGVIEPAAFVFGKDFLAVDLQLFSIDLQINELLNERDEILAAIELAPDEPDLQESLMVKNNEIINATTIQGQLKNDKSIFLNGIVVGPIPSPPPCGFVGGCETIFPDPSIYFFTPDIEVNVSVVDILEDELLSTSSELEQSDINPGLRFVKINLEGIDISGKELMLNIDTVNEGIFSSYSVPFSSAN